MCHNSIYTKKDTEYTDATDFYFIKRIVYQIIINEMQNTNQC